MSIVKKLLLIASLAFGLAAAVNAANAANETPEALIKRVSQEVLEAAKADKDIQAGNEQKILNLVETKVLPYVDFQKMTQMAAANNWSKATSEQQQELVKQFQKLLIYTYSGALAQVKDQTLQYKAPLYDGEDDVIVRSEVVSSRTEPIQLNYHLTKEPSGWKIYDINVLGAWLIETYKSSFRAEINRSGVDGLIKVLVAKNEKLAKTFAKKSSS